LEGKTRLKLILNCHQNISDDFQDIFLSQKSFELILELPTLSNYSLVDTLFLSVILNYFKLNNCFFVGAINSSNYSEIKFLFLASCSPQIVKQDEDA